MLSEGNCVIESNLCYRKEFVILEVICVIGNNLYYQKYISGLSCVTRSNLCCWT